VLRQARTIFECANQGTSCSLYNFNAIHVTESLINQGLCGIIVQGAPHYQLHSSTSSPEPGAILIGSGFSGLPSDEARITGLVHELGHDLGLEDHYFVQGQPSCRDDVKSIMENWSCEGGDPLQHEQDMVLKAYEVQARPWTNYIRGASNT
jgi:hypothetical protein